jgi:hypothetical protein
MSLSERVTEVDGFSSFGPPLYLPEHRRERRPEHPRQPLRLSDEGRPRYGPYEVAMALTYVVPRS